MTKKAFDVGIIVPLKEEFRYVLEVAPILQVISHEGTFFYRLDFGTVSALGCVVDQMGLIPALQAATRLIGFADVKLLVVLGLGGALDDDVSVGDVVIAREINEFQANSKAEAAGEKYEIHYSGRHWQLNFQIREALKNFEFAGHDLHSTWKTIASDDYTKLEILGKETVCSSSPTLHLGHLASGNVVAASSAFVKEIKKIDRKFIAIDMEAAGVACFAEDRIHPLPCLIVRGISDLANDVKKSLDRQGKGAWRRYGVRNATSLLRHLLQWDDFLIAAGVHDAKGEDSDKAVLSELVDELQECIGGPWIAGIAFGVYFHAPHIAVDGKIVPMDLSTLRVIDKQFNELLEAVTREKEKLLAHGDMPAMRDAFARLATGFRSQLGSEDAISLLRDFDNVVTKIVRPENIDDEIENILIQANRLEEEVGAEAVVDLLKGYATGSTRLRERYVDALANCKMWPEVVKAVDQVGREDLSRLELEHGVFACAKTGMIESASELLKQHRSEYDDNPAKLFRQGITRQYPAIVTFVTGGTI